MNSIQYTHSFSRLLCNNNSSSFVNLFWFFWNWFFFWWVGGFRWGWLWRTKKIIYCRNQFSGYHFVVVVVVAAAAVQYSIVFHCYIFVWGCSSFLFFFSSKKFWKMKKKTLHWYTEFEIGFSITIYYHDVLMFYLNFVFFHDFMIQRFVLLSSFLLCWFKIQFKFLISALPLSLSFSLPLVVQDFVTYKEFWLKNDNQIGHHQIVIICYCWWWPTLWLVYFVYSSKNDSPSSLNFS